MHAQVVKRTRRGIEVRSRIATVVAVALVSAALSVSAAAAGNPNGVPPGQQKASGSPAAPASVNANAGAKAQGKAQAKGAVAASAAAKTQVAVRASTKTHGRAASSVKSSGHAGSAARPSVQASAAASTTVGASAGVKPSNSTFHNTVAPASSNQTKLYGNGKTAGQIATQAGFGSAMLFGPGNSQPHKVICGPHNVDVHALKAHADDCTTPAAAAGVVAGVSPAASAQASVASSVAGQAPAAATKPAASVKGAGASAPTKQSSHKSGVLGARAELASVTKPLSRAVLATVRKGTLPFTGLGLWLPVALGLALIAAGYGVRRKAGALS
jgi:hypothetical protein